VSSDLLRRSTSYIQLSSYDEVRDVLGRFDDRVTYQIILSTLGQGGLPAACVVDALGLGLDMEPTVWAYLCSRQVNLYDAVGTSWITSNSFIEVGSNVMVVLNAVEQRRPKTGIVHFTINY
jgi:hypothetical protein